MILELIISLSIIFSPVFGQKLTGQLFTQKEFDDFAAQQVPEAKVLPEYDFVIIGGGAAGCTLANRLSEITKWTVLLVEAGVRETLDMDIPAFAPAMQQSDVDWKFMALRSEKYGAGLQDEAIMVPRGKVLGGSTVLNYMIYTRGNMEDYNRWANMGNPLWSADNVIKYFRKFENYHVETNDSEIFGHNGPMRIQNTPYETDFEKVYTQANTEYGLPTTNINGMSQIGSSRLQSYTNNGFRISTNRGFLIPAGKRPNLSVKTQCQGSKVLLSDDKRPRATGVEFICDDGTSYSVKARREVILSAGTIKSPQLLMLSGIGPQEDLKKLGIPVRVNLPVGQNLMEHIFPVGIMFTVDKPIFTPTPENTMEGFMANKTGMFSIPGCAVFISYSMPVDNVQTIENLIVGESYLTNDIFLKTMWHIKPEIVKEMYGPYMGKLSYIAFTMLQNPKSRGWVKLADTNPRSAPLINLNILDHPDDLETLVAGIKQNIDIANQKALQDTYKPKIVDAIVPQCKQFVFGTDDYWRCHIRTLPGILYHPTGTNKMGPENDPTSVVNQFLQVRGVDRLRVIDASIMPQIPSGHTSAPSIMIGEHGADFVKMAHGEQIDKLI